MQPSDSNFNSNPSPAPDSSSSFDPSLNTSQPNSSAPFQPADPATPIQQPTSFQPMDPSQPAMPTQQSIPNYSQPVSPFQAQPAVAEDPGKTLSIVGLILAFFVSIAGLIVSIIGRKKSRKAGYSGTIGLIGIIISIITTVFWFLVFLAVMLYAYNGVQKKSLQFKQSAQEQTIYEQRLDGVEMQPGQMR